MRKRLVAVFLVFVLVISCIPGVRAVEQLCFVGVNDNIPLSLPEAETPFYSDGVLYIPYTAFGARPNNIAISNNVNQNNLVLFNLSRRLVYDLENSTVTDEEQNTTSVKLLYRNGVLFVPAVKAASHFGLNVSLLTSKTGCAIIRFTNGQQYYSADFFLERAEILIDDILEIHAKRESQQGEHPEQEEGEFIGEEPVEQGPATVYVAFAGEAVCEETMRHVKVFNSHVAFFLTAEQFRSNAELVRTIYAAGHTIGITVEAGEEDPERALEEANDAMDSILFCRSALALLPEGELVTKSYRVILEETQSMDVNAIMEQEEQIPQLTVIRMDVVENLTPLVRNDAFLPQLLETTKLPQ